MGRRSRSRSTTPGEGRKRLRATGFKEESGERLSAWWAGVLQLPKEAYAAGAVIDLRVPAEFKSLRGPERGIERLYVRKDFGDLYSAIDASLSSDWLCHLNGNSGVGKSAFLWYFIIRFGIDMSRGNYIVVYQSADFIWEFTSGGRVSISAKTDYPVTRLMSCVVHIVNQKIEAADPLGSRVLVAASPHSDNTKSAKPVGVKVELFVHPWDKDEFHELLDLWRIESKELREEADRLKEAGASSNPDESKWSMFVGETKEKAMPDILRHDADELDARVRAGDLYYDWFGGIPRLLRQAAVGDLNEEACERKVHSLSITDLPKVFRAIISGASSDHISYLLLHFKRPVVANARFLLDFASSKIKYQFTATLARTKQEDLMILLRSSDPELGALRGYIFEQEVVRQVLNSNFAAIMMVTNALLVDNKHCSGCNGRTVEGVSVPRVACRRCHKWYHRQCAGCGHPVPSSWSCQPCRGEASAELIATVGLKLRYYDGDLKAALLAAGADAKNYVWRPLNKSNAAFDFVVPPRVFGQATISKDHPVPQAAVEKGVAALEAWNKECMQQQQPQEFLLAFYLSQQNFESFGYQSYRDKHRHVSNKAVKGVVQVKVLIDTYELVQLPLPAEGSVDKLSDLNFVEHDLQNMTVPELKALAKSWGMKGYSSLRKDALVAALGAWEEPDVVENREYERQSYKLTYRDKVV